MQSQHQLTMYKHHMFSPSGVDKMWQTNCDSTFVGDSRRGTRAGDKGKADPGKDKKPPAAKDAKPGKPAKEVSAHDFGLDVW